MQAKLLFLGMLGAAALIAQNQPVLGEETVKVSEHVWAIMGWPNIAVVVGNRATLVVDTGLGPRNGATIARVAAKLAPGNQKLYLTTTHFHPEHAGGDAGFPAGTILIRNAAQQREMELHGKEMIELFAGRSAQNKELLANAVLRTPDIIFEQEAQLDLGGVTARLLWFGGAHTKGDELTFVEPDRTLISGDVVQNKIVPGIFRDGGTPSSWLAVLDKVAALNALLQMDADRAMPILTKVLERRDACSAGLRRKAVFLVGGRGRRAAAGPERARQQRQQRSDLQA